MKTMSPNTELQADDPTVLAVARAMCGNRTPCTYHVRLARIAIPAYEAAANIVLSHEGTVR